MDSSFASFRGLDAFLLSLIGSMYIHFLLWHGAFGSLLHMLTVDRLLLLLLLTRRMDPTLSQGAPTRARRWARRAWEGVRRG